MALTVPVLSLQPVQPARATSTASSAVVKAFEMAISRARLTIGNDALGSGASAEVFPGTLDGVEVAIKKYFNVKNIKKAFKEAEGLSRVQSPHVVRLYGIWADSTDPENPKDVWLVMDRLDMTLADLLAKEKDRLPFPDVVDILLGVARGLAAVHERAIVHRDVKPQNILLQRDARSGRYKAVLGDFDLIAILESDRDSSSSGLKGSAPYMAPECFGNEPSARATPVDMYAFGVVIWQLLTGNVRPWGVITHFDIAREVRDNKKRLDLPSTDDPTKADLVSLAQDCFKEDPGDRPAATVTAKCLEDLENRLKQVEERRRFALVLGNTYKDEKLAGSPLDLPCCENDITEMEKTLKDFNFEVTSRLDVDDLAEAIKKFADSLPSEKCDLVIFFSGHGVQREHKNFMVPNKFNWTECDWDKLYSVDELLVAVGTKSRLTIGFFDMCRTELGIPLSKDSASLPSDPNQAYALFFSSDPGRDSEPGKDLSPFTQCLLTALKSAVTLSLSEIHNEISRHLKELDIGQRAWIHKGGAERFRFQRK